MTRFRKELLDTLWSRADVSDAPSTAPDRAARPTWRRVLSTAPDRLRLGRHPGSSPGRVAAIRLRFALGGAFVALSLLAMAPIVLSRTASTPAYAVTAQGGGAVGVQVNRLADPGAANQQLRDLAGGQMRLMMPSAPEDCPGPAPEADGMAINSEPAETGSVSISIRVADVPADEIVILIPARQDGHDVLWQVTYPQPGPTCVTVPQGLQPRASAAPVPSGSATPEPVDPPVVSASATPEPVDPPVVTASATPEPADPPVATASARPGSGAAGS